MTGPSIAQMLSWIKHKEAFIEPGVRSNVKRYEANQLKAVHAYLRENWTAYPYGMSSIRWVPGKHKPIRGTLV